jgi:competence protein ComER
VSVPSVGIIGTGRIGAILLRAAMRHAPDVPLLLAGRNEAAVAALAAEIPALKRLPAEALAAQADLVLLAVPPDAYCRLAKDLAPHLRSDTVLVSLTNGIALADLGACVSCPVVKVIPTMAQTVGRGVSLVSAGPRAKPRHVERVRSFFGRISRPLLIDDGDSRAASNVAGSSLAIVAAFCRAFVRENAKKAVALDEAALTAAMAETLGALCALVEDGRSFEEIVEATATPGGVTAAALEVLARWPMTDMVEATFARQAAMVQQAGRTR